MKKIISILIGIAAILSFIPTTVFAQVFTQSQLILTPAQGVIISSTTSKGGYLQSISSSTGTVLQMQSSGIPAFVATSSLGFGSLNQWITNGLNIFYNIGGGNVGIATSTPGTALSVVGTTTSGGYISSNLKGVALATDNNGNFVATTTTGGGGSGTITGVTAGTGLTGGGTSGTVTVSLALPVAFTNGGTGTTTANGIFVGSGSAVSTVSSSILAVNVKDYGAKGDGVTDDTASIQRAIDVASSTNSNLIMPNGVYKVNGTLYPGYHNGALSLGIQPCIQGMGNTIIEEASTTAPLFNMQLGFYACLKNLQLIGPGFTGAATTTAIGIYNSGFVQGQMTIQNVFVDGFYQGLRTTNTDDMEIINSWFDSNLHAIVMDGAAHDNIIMNTPITNQYPIGIEPATTTGITITDGEGWKFIGMDCGNAGMVVCIQTFGNPSGDISGTNFEMQQASSTAIDFSNQGFGSWNIHGGSITAFGATGLNGYPIKTNQYATLSIDGMTEGGYTNGYVECTTIITCPVTAQSVINGTIDQYNGATLYSTYSISPFYGSSISTTTEGVACTATNVGQLKSIHLIGASDDQVVVCTQKIGTGYSWDNLDQYTTDIRTGILNSGIFKASSTTVPSVIPFASSTAISVTGTTTSGGYISSNLKGIVLATDLNGKFISTSSPTFTTLAVTSTTTVGGLVSTNLKGLFLATDLNGNLIGTTTPSGGTGTPGGSNTQLQYNNSGAFGGTSSTTVLNGLVNISQGGALDYNGLDVFYASTSLNNTFIGNNAGPGKSALNVTLGNNNTAIGSNALNGYFGFSGGGGNTAIGPFSLNLVTSGTDNVAIGVGAGQSSGQTILQNLFIGTAAGQGYGSGLSTADGVAIGYQAGSGGIIGSNNLVVGAKSGEGALGAGNTLIGTNAGSFVTAITGTFNTILGDETYDIGTNAALNNSTCLGALCELVNSNTMILGSTKYNTNFGTSHTELVGIGTTTPLAQLDVVMPNTNTGAYFRVAQSTSVSSTTDIFGVYNNGFVGISSSSPANLFSIASTTSTSTNLFSVTGKGSIETGGGLPSVSCASTCTLITHANDTSGTISISGVQTSVTLTFSSAKEWAPNCVVSDNATAGTYDASSTKTQLIMSTGVSLGTATITYFCPL